MSEVQVVGWVPAQKGERWPAAQIKVDNSILTIHYDIDKGHVVIKQVSGEHLTSTLVRNANLGSVAHHLTRLLREHPERLSWAALVYALSEQEGSFGVVWESEDERKLFSAVADSARAEMRSRRGPRARNDDLYRQVAIDYLATVKWAKQRVIEKMTAMYRMQPEHDNLSKNNVKTWVRRARETGWLSKGTQGRAGATPGPKLREWLTEQGDES